MIKLMPKFNFMEDTLIYTGLCLEVCENLTLCHQRILPHSCEQHAWKCRYESGILLMSPTITSVSCNVITISVFIIRANRTLWTLCIHLLHNVLAVFLSRDEMELQWHNRRNILRRWPPLESYALKYITWLVIPYKGIILKCIVVVNWLKCNYYWNVDERDLFSLFSFMLFAVDIVHITSNVWHHPNCWHTEYFFIICSYSAILPMNTLCWWWRLLNSVTSFIVYMFVSSKVVIHKDCLQKVKNSDC